MSFHIRFNEEKNQLLKATRKISFGDVVEAIKNGNILADVAHPSKTYQHQRIFIIAIRNYAYAIPYVINQKKKEIFLKTIYASRVFTNKYLKKKKS